MTIKDEPAAFSSTRRVLSTTESECTMRSRQLDADGSLIVASWTRPAATSRKPRFATLLMALPFSIVTIGSANAAEYFVAKNGNDDNNCSTAQNSATPKLTIGSAKTCLSPGDTMWIRAGTYTERFQNDIPSGPSAAQPTTISAYNDEPVILRPSSSAQFVRVLDFTGRSNLRFYGLELDGKGVSWEVVKVATGCHNFTIEGPAPVTGVYKCRIRNGQGGGAGLSFQGENNNVTVRNCEIADNGLLAKVAPYIHNVYFQRGDKLLFEGNYVHRGGCYGIQVYPKATNATLRHNIFADNAVIPECGSQVVLSNAGHLFENNVVYNDMVTGGTHGLRLQYGEVVPSNQVVRHNTFYNAGTHGIFIADTAKNNTIQNNIVIGSATPIADEGTGTVLTTNRTTGSASALFTSVVSPFDFTLKAGSDAIDGGADIGLAFCGTAPDQGAFEVCGPGEQPPSPPRNLQVL